VLDARDFALFKADTIAYLNDFIADLDILAVRIRQRLVLQQRGVILCGVAT